MSAIKAFLRTTLILVVLAVAAAIAYAWSGLYDISVGSGHNPLTHWYLETLKERSIERRAATIEVPGLTDPAMIADGARAYDDGCAGCHGRPGRPPRDRWEPVPPALTRGQPDPAEVFWVVRNGIKMSAMPAYPAEQLDDAALWGIIAFLQTASSLTEGEYRQMVEPPPDPEPEATGEAETEETEGEQPESESTGAEDGEQEDGSRFR